MTPEKDEPPAEIGDDQAGESEEETDVNGFTVAVLAQRH